MKADTKRTEVFVMDTTKRLWERSKISLPALASSMFVDENGVLLVGTMKLGSDEVTFYRFPLR